ncbi:MAG: AAA family ATPase [Deltaproteobacteria bacterium]|nr:AAA family ATPase [Deltaproteobacteria bacterium]
MSADLAAPQSSPRLFGRRADLEALSRALAGARLVTITGPPGVGKTALAMAYVSQLDPSDVVSVYLDRAKDEREVLGLLAAAYGVSPSLGVTDLGSTVVRVHQQRRPRVLFVDNLEHVLDEAARILSLLASAGGGTSVLATSRAPLRLSIEWELRLSPLAIGEHGPAVELLADQCARAGVPLDALEPADLERLAGLLDGLPLALQLAAVWIRTLGIKDTFARLQEAGDLPAGAVRSAEGRTTDLRTALFSGYALLSAGARRAIARLSSFPGSFSFGDAEALLSGDAGSSPAGIIDELLRSSWIAQTAADRLRILFTVRQFVSALPECAEEQARALPSYLARLEEALRDANSSDRESDLLHAAWQAMTRTEPTDALIAPFASLALHLEDAHPASRSIALRRDTSSRLLEARAFSSVPRAIQVGVLCRSAALWPDRAPELLAAARAASRDDVDATRVALAEGELAYARGDLDAALDHFQRGLTTAGSASPLLRGWVIFGLARARTLRRDAAASDAYREALAQFEVARQPAQQIAAAASWIFHAIDRAEHSLTEALLERWEGEAHRRGEAHQRARILIYRGNLARDLGQAPTAREWYAAAKPIFSACGEFSWWGVVSMDEGIVELLSQRYDAAADRFRDAERELLHADRHPCLPLVHAYRGVLARHFGDSAQLHRRFAEAERLCPPGHPYRPAVEILSIHLDPVLAGPPGLWEQSEHEAARSQHVRLARRAVLLSRALREPGLSVRRDGSAFDQDGKVVTLPAGSPPARVLACLALARIERAGEFVSARDLFGEAWPGERASEGALKNRLRVAIAKLRKSGLDALIESRVGGYRLSPDRELIWRRDSDASAG